MSSLPQLLSPVSQPSRAEPTAARRIGLIAGWGDFPLLFARRLH
jgi:DUF1009 family protein